VRALLLSLDDDLYAVDVALAREVAEAPDLTPVPTAPPEVLGVFNLRGEIVPVFDTAALLRVGGFVETPTSPSWVAILHTGEGVAALTTTSMGETVELGELAAASDAPGTVGAYDVGSRLAVLLDVDALLATVSTG
jgi:purine-binding chemotaxis protein CheW